MNSLAVMPPLIVDPLLRRLYQYWERERGSLAMPLRDSVDPIKMRYILGHLALIDVATDRGHFRIRLHGTELVSRLGADFTGKMIDDVPSVDLRRLALTWFTTVVERGAPYHEHVYRVIDGLTRHFEALVLPYSTQRAGVDLILLAVRCRPPGTPGQAPIEAVP
jgi:hypothetical protein